MGLSPMMQHYMQMKEQYPGTLMFYRLGDFYEMFFDDAKLASKELELTLTGRDCGLDERAPMCGVPFHAADTYIKRLVDKGYKVAICEQMEDPKLAKGMVKREVIRVVTPGTITDQGSIDESRNNYLCCIVRVDDTFGLSFADISTGRCMVTEIDNTGRLLDEVYKFTPAEILCNSSVLMGVFDENELRMRLNLSLSDLPDRYFDQDACVTALLEQFGCADLTGLGLADFPVGILSAGALFMYLYETQKAHLSQMNTITPYVADKYMLIDSSTRRNLELTETLREKQKRGSLLWVLDKTRTAMGARLLRNWITEPLIDMKEINERLDRVEALKDEPLYREEMREYLSSVYDLERLLSRIAAGSANPRDMLAFNGSLSVLPAIRQIAENLPEESFASICEDLDPCEKLCSLLTAALSEDAPVTVKEGGIIKDGYSKEVDELREAKANGRQWLSDMEEEEKARTGIKNLRIRYNRVFGYYLEVTNSFKNLVPEDWLRKQTLSNAERYTTERLQKLEETILGADEKLNALEYELFNSLRETVAEQITVIQRTASAVARLDVLASLAQAASNNRYVRPKLNDKGIITITDGRHPVVERMTENDMFIPNDTYLDNVSQQIAVITGPNMAGKSTYMRQTALIVLMAQMGSFVPASEADIGLVDRIFTRVGASDDLASGQSTFMVEMTEVANILRNATKASLLILDEIGRGTSTFDGLSIAWAVIEYIAERIKAKTLFATHYHELTELEGKISGIRNFCIAVKERGDDIVFLRKIIRGGADKSYGIQVAKLAGVPDNVISRAKELVGKLSDSDITATIKDITDNAEKAAKLPEYRQLSFFDIGPDAAVCDRIRDVDLSVMTPIEALNLLYDLQKELKD